VFTLESGAENSLTTPARSGLPMRSRRLAAAGRRPSLAALTKLENIASRKNLRPEALQIGTELLQVIVLPPVEVKTYSPNADRQFLNRPTCCGRELFNAIPDLPVWWGRGRPNEGRIRPSWQLPGRVLLESHCATPEVMTLRLGTRHPRQVRQSWKRP